LALLRAVISSFLQILVDKLIDLSHFLNMPLLTAVAWRLSLKEMNNISHKGPAAKKLIVLAKSGGIDDLEAAFTSLPASFKIYILPRSIVKQTFQHYLEGRVSDAQYLTTDKETERLKLDYRAYLYKVLKHFQSLFGCDAILQFNFVYYAERELAAASSELGIPFLCSYKECLRSAAFWKETEDRYQKNIGPFQGWKIAVYNEQARESIIRSGVAESWQVETVGCARLDYSHGLRNTDATDTSRRVVLFYLIQNTVGLPYLNGCFRKEGENIEERASGPLLSWRSLAQRTNAAILRVAEDNPGVDFIFKGKTGHSSRQREQLGESLPENITVLCDGTGNYLLKQAAVVIGWNTTAVLEAIASGLPTVIPMLLSDYDSFLKPYILDLNGAVIQVTSPEELEQALIHAVNNWKISRELSDSQKHVLKKYLGNDDGRSGERLRKFIEEAVNREASNAL
jgi:hypothetical protein